MSSPVWSVEGKVAWNYIIVADAHIKSVTADIYKYNNSAPIGLPKLTLVASKMFIGLETILKSVNDDTLPDDSTDDPGTPQEEERLQELLGQIVAFGDGFIPEMQRPRTPLFFYGTGNVRALNMLEKHKLMRTACERFKESDYLIGACDKQVTALHEDMEGILAWISTNYRDTLPDHGLVPSTGSILLGNGGATTAYIDKTGAKSSQYKVSLPLGNKTIEMYNVQAQSDDSLGLGDAWERYLKSGDLYCLNPGAKAQDGNGKGDFSKCVEVLEDQFSDLKSLPADITYNGVGELPSIHKYLNVDTESSNFCSMPWDEINKQKYPITDLDRLCFKAGYTKAMMNKFFEGADPQPDIVYPQVKWTLGRALLYAAADVSKSKKPCGIQSNAGSTQWLYGLDVDRPLLGDWAEELDKKSHRLWGGIVFIGILFAVIYLLLGKRKFQKIVDAVRGKVQPQYRNVAAEDFELQERDSRDDFDV